MSEKYSFIDAQKAVRDADGSARYTVRLMCTWLAVSVSGFYDWASRPVSATQRWRGELGDVIEVIFAESDGTYGYRRIHAELVRRGRPCHPQTVRALMGERGLAACQPKARRRALTKPAAQVADIPDLVRRDFTSAVPGAKLVSDITYVRTWQGWLYVALVIDCRSRAIVGYAMADHYKTPLITEAIEMAARNLDLPDGAIAHSDRGSNGEIKWSSQHLECGGVPCRHRRRHLGTVVGSGRRIGRCGRRCVRRVGLNRRVRCSGSSGV